MESALALAPPPLQIDPRLGLLPFAEWGGGNEAIFAVPVRWAGWTSLLASFFTPWPSAYLAHPGIGSGSQWQPQMCSLNGFQVFIYLFKAHHGKKCLSTGRAVKVYREVREGSQSLHGIHARRKRPSREALAEPKEAPRGGPPSWKATLGIVFKSCDAAPGV